MKKRKQKRSNKLKFSLKFLITLVIIAVLIIILVYVVQGLTKKNYDNFAKCLAVKDFKFYGASWCSHCADQKKLFGESKQYLIYVECADDVGGQTPACTAAGITGYPTWKFQNQTLEGVQTLEKLSELSGCKL
ncbi:MAG: hypothetical protein WC796_04915 [Candidatus Pacearchaeota archaeon]|jgi:hypothetical protein